MTRIFVGNLDIESTEQSVRTLFEPYGAVERVNLKAHHDPARAKSFAFVRMTDTGEAARAIAALDGLNLSGRVLKLREARLTQHPRQRPDSPKTPSKDA